MHNGIDLVQAHNSKHRTYRAEWGFTNDDFLVLLLGNVSKAKGYLFLAEVAERTRENERIKYVMAGDYEDKSCGAVHSIFRRFYRKMKNVPVNRNPEKHIILERWAGFIDRGTAIFCGHVDPYRAIATSDLVVCPSQEPESFGRTIIEAYAMACPVIAMSVGGGEQELIESSSEGLLLQMDANEWAERLKELSDNTILMNKFRLNAARKALQFNSEQLSKRIMNLYEDILSG
jgi:glycosyltransferase involved in cell wall biosynthesis